MTENTKYAFTSETLDMGNEVILKRIVALKDFGDVKKGDLGGWLESEENLSPLGDSWVSDEAKVYDKAKVSGNAEVYDKAEVSGNAKVYNKARVFGNAEVYRSAKVFGNAKVYGDARVSGNAEVFENGEVCNRAMIWGNVKVYGDSRVSGIAKVDGSSMVYGNALVTDYAGVSGYVEVYGDVQVSGRAHLYADAKVASNEDYIVFKNNWSSGRVFTWTKSNDMWLVGCFYGTGEELIEKAYKDSEESGRKYELYVNLVKELQK